MGSGRKAGTPGKVLARPVHEPCTTMTAKTMGSMALSCAPNANGTWKKTTVKWRSDGRCGKAREDGAQKHDRGNHEKKLEACGKAREESMWKRGREILGRN